MSRRAVTGWTRHAALLNNLGTGNVARLISTPPPPPPVISTGAWSGHIWGLVSVWSTGTH